MKKQEPKQERDWVKVYLYEKITIVPHYVKKKVFVLPGGREIDEETLVDAGAFQAATYLWPR